MGDRICGERYVVRGVSDKVQVTTGKRRLPLPFS